MENFRWVDRGGEGPDLVFAHANGFPVGSYRPLLNQIQGKFEVFGWESRPLVPGTDPQGISGWDALSDDLRLGIENRFSNPVIGVGHSLGGVCSLLAASSNPQLFRALVLLDPVMFSGLRSLTWGLLKRWGRAHTMPLMAGALRRRDSWSDRELVRRSWSGKPAFEGWTDEAFNAYLEHGIVEDEDSGGYRLRYPKAWEARIFELTPHDVWNEVAKLQVPVLVLRGEHSDTFTASAVRKFGRVAPNAKCTVVEGTGHMLPMQRPDAVARIVLEWLSEKV